MIALIFGLISVLSVTVGGVVVVKLTDQAARDRQRVTYKLSFPSDLDPERVTAWLRTLSGTLRVKSLTNLFTGSPSLVLEVWASNNGIEHRLIVPWAYEPHIRPKLESLIPGIRLVKEQTHRARGWTHVVEIGLKHGHRPLRIANPSDISTSILSNFGTMSGGETLMMQWVLSPAVPEHKPIHGETTSRENTLWSMVTGSAATRDEIDDRRDKLDEPNMMAVLRIGAVARTTVRAQFMVRGILSSLEETRGPAHQFVKRLVPTNELQRRINVAATPFTMPVQLSAPELTAVIGWPLLNPMVSGLPAAVSRRLPAPESVTQVGRVIGESNFSGRERRVAIAFPECRRHVYVVGPTGFGKTVLCYNCVWHDIAAGHGIAMLESKGGNEGLFEMALNAIPRERINDVVILDLTDSNNPIGLNPLDQGDSRVTIDELVRVLKGDYTSGPWIDMVLRNALLTVQELGLSIMDLPLLLMPVTEANVDWRDETLRRIRNPDVEAFWQRLNKEGKYKGEQVSQSTWDRLSLLASRPEISNVLGQTRSSFSMDDVVRDKKILLVNLSGVPQASASIMGTLVFSLLSQSLKRVPPEPGRSMMIYLDEFQHYVNQQIDMHEMLAEVRSRGGSLTMANQYLGQLDKGTEEAIMANAGTKIAFQLNASDARTMATNLGNRISADDIQNLARFEAVARVYTSQGVSAPFTMNTLPPKPGYGIAHEIRRASRAKYGRPVQQVMSETLARRTPKGNYHKTRPAPPTNDFGL